ncbi:hypothetical protein [Butyrivibrio sp. INlla16]|uniref:hypothetical protein n=1 Tax=Butyrivibrio sp. INlla16 TaxID=1520807 RepID=UPI000886719C|nr:hypothetical protein [Butyrivibrio sp. INlla16]SDB54055.1 hypothetical protein SAMN02910263_02737 [Butyrivibrio sp. INlla16]
MMKKTLIAFSTFFALGIVVTMVGITAHAETRQERYQRRQYEMCQKYLDELEEAGNLTQEAIDALDGPNSTRKPNHKSSSSSNNTESGSSSATTQGKGWVYSSDELHVIGLPEGSNGYTKPGYYGDVDGSYSSGYSGAGKGWVYDADELHVIGLPEGEDGYTMPGFYGDID